MSPSIAPTILGSCGSIQYDALHDKRVLHIGCGGSKIKGATGIDILALPGIDIVHDLDSYPWPVDERVYDVVYAHSVVEHISDIVALIEEIWRVLKPGGRLVIVAPYFRSVDAFTDPTHTHFFTSRSLDYFTDEPSTLARYVYSPKRFHKTGFWFGWPHNPRNPIRRFFKRWMTNHQKLYDQYLSLLYPVSIVVWELEKID
jgi:SAM-dependent methyltransferase